MTYIDQISGLCTSTTVCAPGQYELLKPSLTEDRQCGSKCGEMVLDCSMSVTLATSTALTKQGLLARRRL